jgi:acetyl-CoA carboxylase biotin carboxyl carrier protein
MQDARCKQTAGASCILNPESCIVPAFQTLTCLANRASIADRIRNSPETRTPLDLKDIKILIDLMKKNDLSVFQMEKDGFKLLLKKGVAPGAGYVVSAAPAPAAAAPAPALPVASPTEAPPPAATPTRDIVSPMVGTFYQSMSPDSPPYVKVGQKVEADTVVCIIEAMKVMNEVKAEIGGVVTEILGENGRPVQFGQPLFRLK